MLPVRESHALMRVSLPGIIDINRSFIIAPKSRWVMTLTICIAPYITTEKKMSMSSPFNKRAIRLLEGTIKNIDKTQKAPSSHSLRPRARTAPPNNNRSGEQPKRWAPCALAGK